MKEYPVTRERLSEATIKERRADEGLTNMARTLVDNLRC